MLWLIHLMTMYVQTPLCSIIYSQTNQTLDKLTGAFDKLMESDSFHTKLAVVQALAHIIPHLTFKRRFRDECIIHFI